MSLSLAFMTKESDLDRLSNLCIIAYEFTESEFLVFYGSRLHALNYLYLISLYF